MNASPERAKEAVWQQMRRKQKDSHDLTASMCGNTQQLTRQLSQMGHQVKLMAGKAVKAFVMGNKNDAANARAIWMAVQQPNVKACTIKTESFTGGID